MKGPVSDIHQILASADVVVGDSGTMVSEAAVLGTPAVLISPMRASVHDDQVSYGLLARFDPEQLDAAWEAVSEFVRVGPPSGARARMLAAKVDVTDWMTEFFEREFPQTRLSTRSTDE